MEAAYETDDGGFTGAGGADECGDGAGSRLERDAVEDWLACFVLEDDVVEADVALDVVEGVDAGGLGVFFALVEDLAARS